MSASSYWARLFRIEEPRLRRFLRRFGPAVSAEDVTQDSFMRLCAAEPGSVASPRAFLFRTARNLAIDHVRRGKASPVRAVEDLDRLAASAGQARALPSPEDAAVAAETRAAIEAAIAALSEEERTALVLRKVEGLPPEDIAARLGVSARTVQRLIVRALAQIQAAVRALEDKGGGPA